MNAWRTTSSKAPRTASSPISNCKRAEGADPLDIINGPLMTGMTEVGRLFNNNELIVAEVLQSAEAMKAAVESSRTVHGEVRTAARGKIVLATVKGDVHDIGKNLVEIILSNNGYQVINLGIKVPPGRSDPGLAGASTRRDRAVWFAGKERASDGDDGVRFQRSRRAASRCWWAARHCRKNSRPRASAQRTGLRRSTRRTR